MATIISSKTTGGGGASITGDSSGILQLASADGTTAVTIDASQNVGINTTTMPAKLNVAGGNIYNITSSTGATGFYTYNGTAVGTAISCDFIGPYSYFDFRGTLSLRDTNSSYATRLSIDASGNVFVSANASANAGCQFNPTGYMSVGNSAGTTGWEFAGFYRSGVLIGSIAQNGTTAVLYNTTSDYRLKNDVAPIKNALTTIEALNPVSFIWIDDRPDAGFLAHELQAVLPNCVTGEKDAVNEDGTPKYQQMDNSGVVPFLVKAIQELKAIIDLQATRISALESKIV